MPLDKVTYKVQGLETEYGRERLTAVMELSKIGVRMFGHSRTVLAGTVRDLAEAEWVVQIGPTTGTTDSFGNLAITFPRAFGRALVVVLVQTTTVGVMASAHTVSLTGFTARRLDGAAASTTFMWIAVGY